MTANLRFDDQLKKLCGQEIRVYVSGDNMEARHGILYWGGWATYLVRLIYEHDQEMLGMRDFEFVGGTVTMVDGISVYIGSYHRPVGQNR